jgi:hypothetical protein
MKRIALGLALVSVASLAQEPAWTNLFSGSGLDGWQVLAGQWTVEEGVLVGRAVPGETAWIISGAELADFSLEVEFMTPAPCGGGVQIRSHWLPRLPIPENVAPTDAPKTLYGYQADIDTRGLELTGNIVDANGRGVLVKTSPEAQSAVVPGDWNTMRMDCLQTVLEVTVNGVTANRLHDEAFLKGFVALEVTPLDGAAGEMRFRSVRVHDLGRTGTWRPLFDGTTLTGWKNWGTEQWTVQNGAIQGRSGPQASEGYLATEETWKDFRVRGQFMMLGEGNFGLFYRSTITLREDGFPVIQGIQGEVAPGFPSPTGWHYESYRRGWLAEPDMSSVAAHAVRPGAWNEIEIRAIANHITSWVNGIRATDFFDNNPQVFEGAFALQLHTGGTEGIDWKDLYVKE